MKTETQKNPELAQLCKLIEAQSIAMLTTRESDGTLLSRPMAALKMDSGGAIWFFTDVRSSKVEHLSSANLSFADVDKGTYVSVSGHGEIHIDRERSEELWTPFARPWFPEGVESPNLALLKIVPELAEYWDSSHSKMVRMFAMAASIVAAKPIGMGDHATLKGLSGSEPVVAR